MKKPMFQLDEEYRERAIEKYICPWVNEEDRELAHKSVWDVVEKYEGQDIHALAILGHAAKKGRLDEFVQELEEFYNSELRYIDPAFRSSNIHYDKKISRFFKRCYRSLGIFSNNFSPNLSICDK